VAYAATIQASPAGRSLVWSIAAGALPGGLNLNSSTGAISGTPTASGSFAFTVKAQDTAAASVTASKGFTIAIAAAAPPPPPPPPPAPGACSGTLATISSPTPGSTLPGSTVTFAWCNASRDYFLTVETIPGAHDIFNAVVRVTSVTLVNIPTQGKPLYVTLWTQQSGGKTYVAAPTITYTEAKK
jgi:hypothetical protein